MGLRRAGSGKSSGGAAKFLRHISVRAKTLNHSPRSLSEQMKLYSTVQMEDQLSFSLICPPGRFPQQSCSTEESARFTTAYS